MFSIVYITTKDENEAKNIAKHLLRERLVACANMFPIKSLYRWKGEIQDESEMGMILKTRTVLVEKVVEEVKRLHSYDVPCIISFPLRKGNEKFFEWIRDETQKKKRD